MSHYYQNDPSLRSKRKNLELYIDDKKLTFISDSGVFSNSQIDYGSYLLIKTVLKENKVNSLLDVGCGYGVLGISFKHLGFANIVDMVDINEKAVSLSLENINNYKLNDIKCFVSNGFDNITSKYDCIVINPPIRTGKKIIYKMFDDSINHLNEFGALYIVIKKDLGAESAFKHLQTIYKNVVTINKDKGYWIIKSFN